MGFIFEIEELMGQAEKHKRIYYVYGTQRVAADIDDLIVRELESRSMLSPDKTGRLIIKLPPGILAGEIEQAGGPCRLIRDGRRYRLRCVINEADGTTVVLPIVLHRPLPESEVMSVGIVRRLRADKPIYTVRFELRVIADVSKFDGKIAVVNFDWRLQDRPVGVAAIWTAEGLTRVMLPADYVAGWEDWSFAAKARDGALRHMLCELSLPVLLASEQLRGDPQLHHLMSLLQESPSVPRAVRAADRLQQLQAEAGPDFTGESWAELLSAWRREDRRRWQHQCRLHERLVKRRLDIYFNVAAELRKTVTAVFWMSKQTSPIAADDSRIGHSSAGTLRRVLEQRFPCRCVPLVFPEPPETCPRCGTRGTLSLLPSLICEECGNTWDVELNIIARGWRLAQQLINNGIFDRLEGEHGQKQK